MMYACPMTHTKVCVYALMHAFDCTCDLLYKLYKPAVHFASDVIYSETCVSSFLFYSTFLIDFHIATIKHVLMSRDLENELLVKIFNFQKLNYS